MINIEHIQRVELRIAELLAKFDHRFNQLEEVITVMAIDLSQLVDEVAAVQSTEAAAVTLIAGIAARLTDAAAGADAATQATIAQLTTELKSATVPLAQAVSVNTPAAAPAANTVVTTVVTTETAATPVAPAETTVVTSSTDPAVQAVADKAAADQAAADKAAADKAAAASTANTAV
jgi:hypothetical protein